MEITQQYFCPQQHVLLVNDSEIGNANQITCQICESSVVAPFYSSFMSINVSNEFQKTESFRFHCCDCDFKLHLLCGPLPRIIKYEGHVHSLLLVDSFIEDSSGEYNCDICETKRNPRIRIYCCGDCKYFAHVHCVISENK
ncbi:hypothetical protein G4B88_000972 [Cannabis sativa]|uniref:DC1 domain-containing protein n=1 Tax=Cannabis sativa TaxID=3483 RepID=A0A7J6FDI0_CANSA|nr:hypothetical protein G4B88_000972 [Cannabis sativa]